uniref:Uncharacterized protein n=1 Tax=Oryza meridionalis TaxID=40149 RepID=A0A0E0E2K0_9ORYZ
MASCFALWPSPAVDLRLIDELRGEPFDGFGKSAEGPRDIPPTSPSRARVSRELRLKPCKMCGMP